MNYYYDVLLNFQDKYYMFYEWDKDDSIEHIKKIPLFHINEKAYIDIISNKIKVPIEFLNKIENKTKLNHDNTIKYSCIFGDGKNNIAVEFDNEGNTICKSSLLLDDEININEFMYNIDIYNLKYEIIDKDIKYKETRQEAKIKNILKIEIKNMYECKNKSKLKYVYLEWFNDLCDDYNLMYNNMIKKIDNTLTIKEYEIYELIKMTYNV